MSVCIKKESRGVGRNKNREAPPCACDVVREFADGDGGFSRDRSSSRIHLDRALGQSMEQWHGLRSFALPRGQWSHGTQETMLQAFPAPPTNDRKFVCSAATSSSDHHVRMEMRQPVLSQQQLEQEQQGCGGTRGVKEVLALYSQSTVRLRGRERDSESKRKRGKGEWEKIVLMKEWRFSIIY